MIFLTGHKTRRSASVRTLENSVLEAWHPERISKEYDQMPFIIKYITKQTVSHLIRMDNMISEFAIRKEKEKEKKKALASKPEQKRPFRKPIEMDCLYRPIDCDEIVRLWGRIKNISKGGVRLNISRLNAHEHPHDLGAEFVAQGLFPQWKTDRYSITGRELADARRQSNAFSWTRVCRNEPGC